MLKKLVMLLVISVPLILAAGCGGTSSSGSTSLFETASVSFLATTVNATSTVTAKPNSDDSATSTITVITQAYPDFTISPFTVRNLKYVYTQTSGGTSGFTVDGINFDTSLAFNQDLASGAVKDQLIDLGFQPEITSLIQPWIFDVQATYTVVEDNSGKSKDYSVPLGSVRFK